MKKQILITICSILLIQLVAASVDVNINVNSGFVVGENIEFDYTLTSEADGEIIYTPRIECVGGYKSLLAAYNVDLIANVGYTNTYDGIEITREIEPQQCLAIVDIKSPTTKTKSEIFEIVGEPSIVINLKICKDISCEDESTVFVKGEEIYFDYVTDLEDPEISATLTYLAENSREINLPSSIEPNELGTYKLEITASSLGYKTITKTKQFAIIAEHADIETTEPQIMDGDGNLIKDPNSKSNGITKFGLIGLIVGIIILILIVVVAVIYILAKRKQSNE